MRKQSFMPETIAKEYRIPNNENKSYIIFNDCNTAENYLLDTMLADPFTYLLDSGKWMIKNDKGYGIRTYKFVTINPVTKKAEQHNIIVTEAERNGYIRPDWTVEWRM